MNKAKCGKVSVLCAAAAVLSLLAGCGRGGESFVSSDAVSESETAEADPVMTEFKGNASIGNSGFFVEFNSYTGGINRLICPGDENMMNFVAGTDNYGNRNTNGDKWFGDVDISLKTDGSCREISTSFSSDIRSAKKSGRSSVCIDYTGESGNPAGLSDVSVNQKYSLSGDELIWDTVITNTSGRQVTLGSVSFPLMFNSALAGTNRDMYENYVYNHSFIGYHETYFYICRNSGNGKVLLLYPKNGTSVEYQYWRGNLNCTSMYTVAGNSQDEYPGSSYLELSTKTLEPGESVCYSFGFRWVDSIKSINDGLYSAGKTAFRSLPGMVVPADLAVSLALRTEKEIDSVKGEFPGETGIDCLGTDGNGNRKYRISFSRTGQNTVDIRYSDGTRTALLYFVTEPLGDLIEKNTAFISKNQQQTDPSDECYMGFLPWDMVMADLTGDGLLDEKNNRTSGYFPTGWWHYGGDEMGYSPALYLSLKNVYMPDRDQIKQLVDYINVFICGKMTEKFSDGTYRLHRGAPWYIMGEWKGDVRIDKNGIDSNADCWRSYNYPHVINTYYNMYRIALNCDYDIDGMLDSGEYLHRAYDLMYTFFTKWMYPKGDPVRGEGGIHFGNMGETEFFAIAEALKKEGFESEYRWLKKQLDEKAEYFADEKYPYSSESYFDTAAYEAVFAYARYSGNTALAGEVTKTNIATRGTTPVWYLYGSDLPSQDKAVNLRYMTQLGGWSLMQYALEYSDAAESDLQLAYGSYLAGWALINSGWYSDKPYNVGSSVWYYQGIKGTLMDSVNDWEKILPVYNGAVAVSGESALGFWAGLNMACTAVIRDSVFGLYAYGGDLSEKDGRITVKPKDGVRKRVHVVTDGRTVSAELSGGRISLFEYAADMSSLGMKIERTAGFSHCPEISITGLAPGEYSVFLNGERTGKVTAEASGAVYVGPEEASGGTVLSVEITADPTK